MRKVNEEILFAEYDKLIADKVAKEEALENLLNIEKDKIDTMLYSDHVKEVLFKEVSAEIEDDFAEEFKVLNTKINLLEKFIIEVEDVFRDMEDELQSGDNEEDNLFQDNTEFMN